MEVPAIDFQRMVAGILVCINLYSLAGPLWHKYIYPLITHHWHVGYDDNAAIDWVIQQILLTHTLSHARTIVFVTKKNTIDTFINIMVRLARNWPTIVIDTYLLINSATDEDEDRVNLSTINLLTEDLPNVAIRIFELNSENYESQLKYVANEIQKPYIVLGGKGITGGYTILPGKKPEEASRLISFPAHWHKTWIYFPQCPPLDDVITLYRSGDRLFRSISLNLKAMNKSVEAEILHQWWCQIEIYKRAETHYAFYGEDIIDGDILMEAIASISEEGYINKEDVKLANFNRDIQVAKTIFKTSSFGSKGKYNAHLLLKKGHRNEDFKRDISIFVNVIKENKQEVQRLRDDPKNRFDAYVCPITLMSTFKSLIEESEEMLQCSHDKFLFIKKLYHFEYRRLRARE